MDIQHSIEIEGSRKTVFSVYLDVPCWPSWDQEVDAISLPNGLTLGSTGWLKPRTGPKVTVSVTEVSPDLSFTLQSRLPLCRMLFGHDLSDVAKSGQTRVSHWARFEGPLAFFFRRVIGKEINAALPETLQRLKQIAERTGVVR